MARGYLNEKIPHQVSDEQNTESSATIAFSNGSLYSRNGVILRKYSEEGERPDKNTPEDTLRCITNDITASAASNTSQVVFDSSGRPPRYPEFKEISRRQSSFLAGWINSSPSPANLSRAGFFFTGQADLVRCYQCGIGLKDFSEGDDPLNEHVRHSEHCPHLLDLLGPSALSQLKRDVTSRGSDTQRGNIRHPEFRTPEARLATFLNWPHSVVQTPAQLVDAGFFYTGTEYHVRCFACDGGLRRWDPEDDPWTEHCRWFPACPFAIATKGQEYIALVLASAERGDQEYSELVPTVPASRISRDPALKALLDEYRNKCRDMGFEDKVIEEGIEDILNRGDERPSLAEVIDAIEIAKERRQEAIAAAHCITKETPLEENERLKRTLTCMKCGQNRVNALLLPCTHHKLCMKCAESLSVCPICQRIISEKIKTFLV